MNNIKKLKFNALSGLLNQVVTVIAGLILPSFILTYYGSEINGLTQSINQFLAFISFLELGVGSVVQSALYGPIATNNLKKINIILSAAKNFFNNLVLILLIYVIGLILFLPLVLNSPLDYVSTSFLILAMSIGLFAQYYFGIIYQLFLNADQKTYIHVTAQIVTVILNTIASIYLMKKGYSIQIIRLSTGIIYLLRPLYLKWYVEKNYKISYKEEYTEDAIQQKWNGVAQHIANTILQTTDMIVLSFFSTLENVSIYSIHSMVVTGVMLSVNSSIAGVKSFFGNLLGQNQIDELNVFFGKIEWLMLTAITFIFGMTMMLLNPFVLIYTQGIYDANYDVPLFAIIFTLAQTIYCYRLPYYSLIVAAGHYRQTQTSAIIEVLINIIVSIMTVNKFGLVGVSVGTLVAMLYRTIYFIGYIKNNILFRPISYFIKYMAINLFLLVIMMLIKNSIYFIPGNYFEWVLLAIFLAIIFLLLILIINYIFCKEILLSYSKK